MDLDYLRLIDFFCEESSSSEESDDVDKVLGDLMDFN